MIKSLLVGLDSGENRDIVQKYALELGSYFGARVTGIHLLDLRKLYSPFVEDLLYSAGLASIPDLQSLVRERLEKLGETIREDFERSLNEFRLQGECLLQEGVVSHELCKEARKHDIMVLGTKGEHSSITEIILGSTFSEMLRIVAQPILVVPEACNRFYIRRILVAYDGSGKSSNALRFAAQSVRDYNLEIEVVVCDDGSLEDAEATYEEASAFLKTHDVKWGGRIIKGGAADCLLEHAQTTNCDVLAFGASHSGVVRELFLGSVARQLLENTKIPCLMVP